MSAPVNTSHHGVMVQKKGLGVLPSPHDWWSWGDLNPRPQAFFGQFYMCSRLVCVSPGASHSDTLCTQPVPYFLAARQGTR